MSRSAARTAAGDRGATRAMCLNGVLWVLRTGAPWKDLPDRYPPYQTCHRRFQQWQRSGVLRDLLACLAEDLRQRGKLDLTEGFVDASFTGAKKGAPSSVLRRRGKGNKIMAIVNRRSLPLAVHVASASPGEVTLVDATLDARFIAPYPAAADRRPRLRQRPARRATRAAVRHRDDRAASRRARPARDTRRPRACGATSAAGSSNASSPGYTTRGDSSPAGNATSRTSSACCSSAACESSSTVYEMASRHSSWNIASFLGRGLRERTKFALGARQ